MPLVPMRLLLDHAAENDYGLAAFNVNDMEQIQAIMEAARETESPVIVQASRGARSYSQDNYLRHLMLAAAELWRRPTSAILTAIIGLDPDANMARIPAPNHAIARTHPVLWGHGGCRVGE